MSKDFAAAVFDPNTWYHISEERVDNYNKTKFQSSFQIISDNGTVVVYPAVNQNWQLLPVSATTKGRYALRNSQTGVAKQLGVCRIATEQGKSKTQPCMRPSDGGEAQMWDVADWGDETLRFVNVANGTDYVLDVHPGNPVFLNDDVGTDTYQPAQHWLITSVNKINDGAFSTTFTNEASEATAAVTTSDPSSTSNPDSSSSSSTPKSSSSGLSTGAAAGIGIGIGLAAILLALLGFFLWRRRNNAAKRTAAPEAPLDDKPPTYTGQYYPPAQELPTPSNVAEVQGSYHAELDSTPVPSTVSSPDWKKQPSPQPYQL